MLKRALTFGLARPAAAAEGGQENGEAEQQVRQQQRAMSSRASFPARRRMSDSVHEEPPPARTDSHGAGPRAGSKVLAKTPFKRAASTSALHVIMGSSAAPANLGALRDGETSRAASASLLTQAPAAPSPGGPAGPPSATKARQIFGAGARDTPPPAAPPAAAAAHECKTHGEDFYATAGPCAVLAQALPGDDDFELLVDPIPPSNRSSLVGLSQTWRNMRADRRDGEPGMQILYGSLPFLVKFLAGSRGYGYWNAFLTTYWQFTTPSEVLALLESFITGTDPCSEAVSGRSLDVMLPSDDGIMAVVSHKERDLAPKISADADADASAGTADDGSESSTGSKSNLLESSEGSESASAPSGSESASAPSRDTPPSASSSSGSSAAAAEGGGNASSRPEPDSLRRIFKELGLDADTATLQRNAHALLCAWMRQEGGNNVLSEDEAQLATNLMAAMDEWAGPHEEEAQPHDTHVSSAAPAQQQQQPGPRSRFGLRSRDDAGVAVIGRMQYGSNRSNKSSSSSSTSTSSGGGSGSYLPGSPELTAMAEPPPPPGGLLLRKTVSENAAGPSSAAPPPRVTLRNCHTAGSNGKGAEEGTSAPAEGGPAATDAAAAVPAASAAAPAGGGDRPGGAASSMSGLRVETGAQHLQSAPQTAPQTAGSALGASPEHSPRVMMASPPLTPQSAVSSIPALGVGAGMGGGSLGLASTVSAPSPSSSSSVTSATSTSASRRTHKKTFTLDFGVSSGGGRSPTFNKVGARARSLSHGWKKKRNADSVSSEEGGVSMSSPAASRGHGGDAELEGFSPSAVAHFLTWQLYDDAYRFVEPRDLVTKEARDKSVAVQRMIELFDKYAWWALTYILSRYIHIDERVNRLLYFVDVSMECRKLNNFHAFFGLVAGLSQPMLQWLWDFSTNKTKQYLENLKRAVRSKGDYLVYRADLSKAANKSHIPFLGLTTRLLYPLEHNTPFVSPDRKRMVNFSRCVSLQNTIDDFLRGQLPGFEVDGTFPIATVDGVNAKIGRATTAGSTDSSSELVSDASSTVIAANHAPFAGLGAGAGTGSPPRRGGGAPSEAGSTESRETPSQPRGAVVVPKARGSSLGGSSTSILAGASSVRLNFDEAVADAVLRGMRRARTKPRLEKLAVQLKQRITDDLKETLEHSGFM